MCVTHRYTCAVRCTRCAVDRDAGDARARATRHNRCAGVRVCVFARLNVRVQRFLNLRYKGTDTAIMVRRPDSLDYGALR
jgi:hypothetical protein